MPQARAHGAYPVVSHPDVGWRDLLALTRPRVTLVAALTGSPVLAQGALPPAAALGVLAGLVLLAGGCSALNAWIERDRDALMTRTRNRPLPAHRLQPGVALVFGVVTAAGGIATLAVWGSLATMLLGVATLVFYLGAYTLWAKPRTPWSAVVGAVPGAAAPLIADAAVNGTVGPWGWTLFAIVFLWQPPHVWAIELFRSVELAQARLPTMPDRMGANATRRLMSAWILALVPVTLLPWFSGELSSLYGAVALGAGLYFVGAVGVAVRKRHRRDDRNAFVASLVHVTAVFAMMLAESIVR